MPGGNAVSDEQHSKKRILLVDPSTDNRDVLATALDPHRVEILHARGLRTAMQLLSQQHPQLILVDEATLSAEQLTTERHDGPAPEPTWIVLGSFPVSHHDGPVEVVAKPYHYAPLIRKILALLEGDPQ